MEWSLQDQRRCRQRSPGPLARADRNRPYRPRIAGGLVNGMALQGQKTTSSTWSRALGPGYRAEEARTIVYINTQFILAIRLICWCKYLWINDLRQSVRHQTDLGRTLPLRYNFP